MKKCPSYRYVRLTTVSLTEVFYEKHNSVLPGYVEVYVLEKYPSYGKSVLRGFTVSANNIPSNGRREFVFFVKNPTIL